LGWALERSQEHPVQVTTKTGEMFTALIPFPASGLALMKGFRKTQMEEYKQ